MPAGAKFDMILTRLDDGKYQLQKARVFTGTYTKNKKHLALSHSNNKQIGKMAWEILGRDKMILRVSEMHNGSDYTGTIAVMKKLVNQKSQVAPKQLSPQVLPVTKPINAVSKPSASKNDKNGETISFSGIRSISKQNGKITDVRVGDTDENMKEYVVVLDAKGKEFAKAKGVLLQVTGTVEIKNGKRMLTITEFK